MKFGALFSAKPPESSEPFLSGRLVDFLGPEARIAGTIGGGKNSRVLEVRDGNGRLFVLKCYFSHPAEIRDRLAVEWQGLKFLWDRGLRCIPQPLLADTNNHQALYRYVEGRPFPPEQAGLKDISAAVDFLTALHELRNHPEAAALPAASEGFFSGEEIIANLDRRLGRLRPVRDSGPNYQALGAFLQDDFQPLKKKIIHRFRTGLADWDTEQPLPPERRTLSPSDFGFHNALRTADGGITFLDLEYFGWDDPAKMISDFTLHPGMDLSPDLKKAFVDGVLDKLDPDGSLARRLPLYRLVFGLQWVLILLNEFIPSDFQRRSFAAAGSVDRFSIQQNQLAKAQKLLRRIKGDFERDC